MAISRNIFLAHVRVQPIIYLSTKTIALQIHHTHSVTSTSTYIQQECTGHSGKRSLLKPHSNKAK